MKYKPLLSSNPSFTLFHFSPWTSLLLPSRVIRTHFPISSLQPYLHSSIQQWAAGRVFFSELVTSPRNMPPPPTSKITLSVTFSHPSPIYTPVFDYLSLISIWVLQETCFGAVRRELDHYGDEVLPVIISSTHSYFIWVLFIFWVLVWLKLYWLNHILVVCANWVFFAGYFTFLGASLCGKRELCLTYSILMVFTLFFVHRVTVPSAMCWTIASQDSSVRDIGKLHYAL